MIDPAKMDELFRTYGERALAWAAERGMPGLIEKMELHPAIADAFYKLLVLAWMEGAAAERALIEQQAADAPRIVLLN